MFEAFRSGENSYNPSPWPAGSQGPELGADEDGGGGKRVQNQRSMFMGTIEREFVSTVYLVRECVCVRRSVRLNRRGFLL